MIIVLSLLTLYCLQTRAALTKAYRQAKTKPTVNIQELVNKAQVSSCLVRPMLSHLACPSFGAESQQLLVTELNSVLVAIDKHHDEILQLRRRIQPVNEQITGYHTNNRPTHVSADPRGSRNLSPGVFIADSSREDPRNPRREPDGRAREEGSVVPEVSEDGEASASETERERERKRERKRERRRERDRELLMGEEQRRTKNKSGRKG